MKARELISQLERLVGCYDGDVDVCIPNGGRVLEITRATMATANGEPTFILIVPEEG